MLSQLWFYGSKDVKCNRVANYEYFLSTEVTILSLPFFIYRNCVTEYVAGLVLCADRV